MRRIISLVMTTTAEPTQTVRPLQNGGVWIEGRLTLPPEGLTGPLVMGQGWLLEMIRTESGHTRGFFWAPFAIIRDFPELDDLLNVGFADTSRFYKKFRKITGTSPGKCRR